MNGEEVAVIIVNWSRRDDTLACLASLRGMASPVAHTLVVDNGSNDGSVAAIRGAFADVDVLEGGRNLGFSAGVNVGLQEAMRRRVAYALLLNNDSEVAADCVPQLLAAAAIAPEIGVVGPTIYYFDRPSVVWSAGGRIDWKCGRTHMLGLEEIDGGQFGTQPRPVEFVTGCCLLLKTCILARIGLFDPRFFAYYEETEWCVRVRRAGFTILHQPAAKAWHKIAAPHQTPSPLVQYYMTRNRLLFLHATGAGWRPWLHTLIEYLRTGISWSVRPRWRAVRWQRAIMLRAVLDYFAGRFGAAPLQP
jgi:GT2 family glycosyltransferase